MSMILNPRKKSNRLLGRWRLLHGRCPRCNSDAPKVNYCCVCSLYHKFNVFGLFINNTREYPNLSTKALWWYNWVRPSFEINQKNYEESYKG